MPDPAATPVFILCGGLGSRLGEVGRQQPKPMLDIGDRPMLLHVMECYARYGFRRFVVCTGHRREVISSYFLNFNAVHDDFTIDLASGALRHHHTGTTPDWEVTVAHTGNGAMTGARIARAAARHLGPADHFAVTYGDGLTDADLAAELAFHLAHDSLATMLGVGHPSPFGHVELDKDVVLAFREKPRRDDDWVSGGFFLFRRAALEHFSTAPDCVLERDVLPHLAAAGQLRMFRWAGFWSCVDTVADQQRATALWEAGAAPWSR